MREIGQQVTQATDAQVSNIDPYLVLAFERGLIEALGGLHEEDAEARRASVRIGLEQMRQALRDMLEELPVSETRSPKEIASWLVETLDVPMAQLSELIGVNPRTFQRWVSAAESASPRIEEARRQTDLRILEIQNFYKFLAVALPPIPPLLVGLVVFVSRRLREREGIAKSRLRD